MAKPPHHTIRRALISVYDKRGVVAFARELTQRFGIEIVSTGGTASLLVEHGIPVTMVEELTGFPELLDGRVKTLHPKIHAAILADRDNPEHMRQLDEQGIKPIDLVVVNLYPFSRTVADANCSFEQAIEMIDIGGPCLVRAAAKNHKHVLLVVAHDEADYEKALNYITSYDRTVPGDDLHARWACEGFWRTSVYDAQVARWLNQFTVTLPPDIRALYFSGGDLRYGENPHQKAERLDWFDGCDPNDEPSSEATVAGGVAYDSPEFSFNNFADAHAALELCKDLSRELPGGNSQSGRAGASSASASSLCACVLIKHTNACGAGVAEDPAEAYRRAYLGDPNAAMGGILACNIPVDRVFAEAVMETYARWGKEAGAGGFFLEVWIAPQFDPDAVEYIRTAKPWGRRVRLLEVGDMNAPSDPSVHEYRSISGGMLAQTRDLVGLNEQDWKVVTKRSPTDSELADLRLAWLIAKHTKSNAISICKDGRLIGNGAGQMSRVMSCRIAVWLAGDNGHKERLSGAAAASDAFFPFSDGPNILMDAGVTALIQPGGSKRDEEVIAACDARHVAMIFTGTRHFKH